LSARLGIATFALAGALVTGAATAQSFPTKPIRIVTSEPGGGNDFAARMIVPGLSGSLGQQVLVDNRPAGVIPGQIVAKSPPDGHTLLLTTGLLWILPLIQSAPFDAARDFVPVVLIASTPNILVTHPSLPVKSVRELITLAKARPGELDYASGAVGASSHLAAELFKSMARVDIVRVPYRGAGPAVLGIVSGQVQVMFATASSVRPHIDASRLKALAVTSARRSAVFPALPTVAEAAGLNGYETATPFNLFAPAGTPAAIVNRLYAETAQVLEQKEVKERFLATGVEVVAGSPEALAAEMKTDSVRMSKLIKSIGIRAE